MREWAECITGLRPNPTRHACAGGVGARAPAGTQGSPQCDCSFRRLQRSGGRCRPSLQPEPVMTLPRTAAEVLSGHVTLEVRCIDRVMLTLRQPRLQYGQGIHKFFCQHRGNRFVSSALMLPMTERFTADIRHYIDTRRLDLVRFAKGQSKDQVDETVDFVVRIAGDIGCTPAQVALAWLAARRGNIIPLLGATSVSQLDENLAAVGMHLDDQL